MENIKLIAGQARAINLYKNTRSKLLKCCEQRTRPKKVHVFKTKSKTKFYTVFYTQLVLIYHHLR